MEGLNKQLLEAAKSGNEAEVLELIKRGAELNCKGKVNETALFWAADRGHANIVKLLIERGVEVNAKSISGETAIHAAAERGHDNSVKILVGARVDVNAKNDWQETALHLAADRGHDRIVEILVEGGWDINAKSISGRTPLDLANTNLQKKMMDLSKKVEIKDFIFPKIDDVKEFGTLMSKGTYSSFNNIVYLGGACNVGKTTLASILTGEDIPLDWHSTDGLNIFFGCFGIDLETKEMVPITNVQRNEVLSIVLLGQPGVEAPTCKDPEISIQSNGKEKDETKSKGLSTVQGGATKQSQDIKPTPIKISHKPSAKSYASIRDDIKEELKKGTYKVKIAPSDLVDFGGQRSFDMTHQLFIRQKGVFVLMLDGRKNLHETLPEYPQGDITTASILLHWVNSILTYCKVVDIDDDILPLIIFVATHSDSFPEEKKLEARKFELTRDITALFGKHEHCQRILYDSLYFINGRDKSDIGITNLKSKLVEVAVEQKSWGQKMPMAWVPLELQISDMRRNGINLISIEQLSDLNAANDEMALSKIQQEHFLKSQHSLGRIIYYDLPGLQSFIIIQPKALVDILRSVITDDQFWPKDPILNKILRDLCHWGRITKHDLFLLWSQKEFNHYMPKQEIKNFIAKVLVYLDILVEPKRFIKDKAVIADFYLVPCIVNRSVRQKAVYDTVFRKRTICLSYRLIRYNVPSAVSYKLIGALLNIWPVKETSEGICLFHKSAILSIDDTNELSIFIKNERVIVCLTNTTSSQMISPDIASVVQECVSFNLKKVIEFYRNSFGNTVRTFHPQSLFEMEVGEPCSTVECLIPVDEACEKTYWTCDNGNCHKTKVCLLWTKKETKNCSPECEGLDDQSLQLRPTDRHLAKLAGLIEHRKFKEFALNLGLEQNELDDIIEFDKGDDASIIRFRGLCRCRMKKESKKKYLIFRDLLEALQEINYNNHYLCKVRRENVELYGASAVKYQYIPDDQVLEELAKKIGNCALHLGVELGLELPTIEQILCDNSKVFGKNRDILFEWKNSGKNKTLLFLMKALQEADPRGLTFLREKRKSP